MRVPSSSWACAVVAAAAVSALAQDARVWRCGNEYTNAPPAGRGCEPVREAAVTVIEGTRPSGARAAGVQASSATAVRGEKVDVGAQRQRDQDARAVLEAEWQRARQQHERLLREWNDGQPARQSGEAADAPRYRERVAQLRQSLQRSEADLAGLRRELSRLEGGAP